MWGVVYKVRDPGGTPLALKQIRTDSGARQAILRMAFEREYQVLASIDHPGIIRVYDYGLDGDQPYYTMEYVQGRDLRELAPMPWRDACGCMRDVASALSLLHARRLLHRDLSPNNVKITPADGGKLLDFGALADFGYPKWVVGTPPLVAPETLAGGMLDQRVDLYALGALMYWLLTGSNAYPAAKLEDLPALWKRAPPPPSAYDPAIPGTLDALTLSLLSAHPLARPTSAAEVIAHLNGIAELEPHNEAERRRLARSFLTAPAFVGRDTQIALVSQQLEGLTTGRGGTIDIRGTAGSGRTRLLEETGVRAQIAGATVIRVDASMHAAAHGTGRALALRLFEALPELARAHGQRYRPALAALGRDVLAKLDVELDEASSTTVHDPGTAGDLGKWILGISRVKPLVLQIDNAEYVDDVSLGLLLIVARAAARNRVMIMLTERSDLSDASDASLRTLRELSTQVALPNLTRSEMLEQVRAMFGNAPNVKRFAEWLREQTAGNPLLSVELSRQLVDRELIRYTDGMWELPSSQPATTHSRVIEDVLASRLSRLSPHALELARCLSLQSSEATFALCVLVSSPRDDLAVRALLDELASCDVMQGEQDAYRFSSAALREVLLANTDDREREASHLRLGRALLQLAGDDHVLRIEAGWHLLRGGHELEGAELINEVMKDAVAVRRLNVNMNRIAAPAEAALEVYKRHRRDPYARMPLLCALALAGNFEHWQWDARYGDEALDLLDDASGMRLARRLRFLGRYLSLMVALLVAYLRYRMTPKRDRPLSFVHLNSHMFGVVLTSVGVAAMKLDGDRAERVAQILQPYEVLPPQLTAPSVYRFCLGLQQIAREHQAEASQAFDLIVKQIADPNQFRLIPHDARMLFVCGAHFARGAFAIFRDDARAALESASVLEESGLRMYAMVASQLRFLYHINRGESGRAAEHRAQVELHAAHFGSAWQVELWESAALLPLQLAFEDATAVARIAHQLKLQSRTIPSLRRYARLAGFASYAVRNEALASTIARAEPEVSWEAPRSFIGWTAAVAVLARAHNMLGNPAAARDWCARALALMTSDDREYVRLFLGVELQAAIAEGKLGDTAAALARIDALLARFRESDNPLTLGLLHETRARIAWEAARLEDYERSLERVEHWFGGSDTPALVAKFERLLALSREVHSVKGRLLPANSNAQDLSSLSTDVYDQET